MRIITILALACLFLAGCDPNGVYDDNRSIPGGKWHYRNALPFEVQITDTNAWYNVYVNLRVSSDYAYNNIFLWVTTTNPARKSDKRRVEIRLADEHGKWLGSGLGDIYDYQFPAIQKVKFPVSGFYRFELEQNMRDDTLQYVKSAGIRVEKMTISD